MSGKRMKMARQSKGPPEMRDEYDFSGGIRAKYAQRINPDTKMVVLDPDVAAAFSSGTAVNRALRTYLEGRGKKAATRRSRAKRSAAR